ncbi:aspartyl-phosphate phosphatase Spo0E family protein [Pontibacillus sp. HMF3514]|uniref:aspartyl-phosphate phosphatase Spo0E family protein n=1 Tax=Pontibacillus sp. HMF3514 TaxID=2692425 RepID=UPI001F488B6B|nr:aspartyl-phosphate phosphatase Spo0E family protein [Pontibacillus sp. HMF3514]
MFDNKLIESDEHLGIKIREKRKEMLDRAMEFGIESDETLTVSQELDLLINQSLHKQIKYRMM